MSSICIDEKWWDVHVKNYGSVGCNNTKPLARDQLYGSATINIGITYKDKDRGSVGQSAEQEDSGGKACHGNTIDSIKRACSRAQEYQFSTLLQTGTL